MSARPARPRVAWRTLDGILLLDKPVGLTSNQALQRARRLYRAAKAGHTGSLDPFAGGVLPLCFGQATKVAGLLLESDKSYRAVLVLGSRTATGDRDGPVVERRAVPPLEAAAVSAVLGRFLGAQTQVPPMYSALKRDGEPLYALARRGVEVERAARPIRIDHLTLARLDQGTIEFNVGCSKGTYVRVLGEDIAVALGTCGHLTELTRTEVGAFAGRPAYGLATLEALAGDEAALDALLLPVDAALECYPACVLGALDTSAIRQGRAIDLSAPPESRVRLYADSGSFIGVGQADTAGHRVLPIRLMSEVARVD